MSSSDYYDMSPTERERFENDCASAWVDDFRDRQVVEQAEREAARSKGLPTEGDK